MLFRSQPTWITAPVQDHSHKPEEQYAIVERCSPGPYVELFARRRQPGWDAWGNETPHPDLRLVGRGTSQRFESTKSDPGSQTRTLA